ncbi:Tannase [Dactylellina cionopaga]|nr:Tannase [Dactylellina cionopaga]
MKLNYSKCAFSAFSAILSATSALAANQNFQYRCSRLSQSLKINSSISTPFSVLFSGYVTNGTNITFPGAHPTCEKSVVALADMCRLRLNITTSNRSGVTAEVWMPVDWEDKGKRFVMTGNGGINGCINFSDMKHTVLQGFATGGHNNGHDGGTAIYFLNNKEVFTDFASRALLTATKISKYAVNHFYKSSGPVRKSYYFGCSLGGFQGVKAAEDFPEEYHGIVAASPPYDFNALNAVTANYFFVTGPKGSDTWLSAKQWSAVAQAILIQCDGIDGVIDQVIEDPMKCKFRPEVMLCSPGQTWTSHQCLTSQQTLTVRRIFEPFYGNKGRFIYPALQPGHDTSLAFKLLYGGLEPTNPVEFIKYGI